MNGKKRRKYAANSVGDKVIDFLYKNFPLSYPPKIIAKHIHSKESTVRKTLYRLVLKGDNIRKLKRGLYLANVNSKNFNKLEYPNAKFHNITLQFEPIEAKKRGTPLALNTKETKCESQNNIHKTWNWGEHAYDVTFQINQNNTITVHLLASNNPLCEIGFRDFYFWLKGALVGLGYNDACYKLDIRKAELNLDYRRITITPKMLTIEDLLNNSYLRIYKKCSSISRVEVGTTFEGEKAIYDLFLNFVKPALRDMKDDDFMDVA